MPPPRAGFAIAATRGVVLDVQADRAATCRAESGRPAVGAPFVADEPGVAAFDVKLLATPEPVDADCALSLGDEGSGRRGAGDLARATSPRSVGGLGLRRRDRGGRGGRRRRQSSASRRRASTPAGDTGEREPPLAIQTRSRRRGRSIASSRIEASATTRGRGPRGRGGALRSALRTRYLAQTTCPTAGGQKIGNLPVQGFVQFGSTSQMWTKGIDGARPDV